MFIDKIPFICFPLYVWLNSVTPAVLILALPLSVYISSSPSSPRKLTSVSPEIDTRFNASSTVFELTSNSMEFSVFVASVLVFLTKFISPLTTGVIGSEIATLFQTNCN